MYLCLTIFIFLLMPLKRIGLVVTLTILLTYCMCFLLRALLYIALAILLSTYGGDRTHIMVLDSQI